MYRQYGEDGEELLGEYGKIFEEEYNNILNDKLRLFGLSGDEAERMIIRYIFVALILMIFIVDTLVLIRKGIVLTAN